MGEGKWMILGGFVALAIVALAVIFYGGGEKKSINESSSPAEIVVQEVVGGIRESGKTGTMTTKATEKQEPNAVAEQQKAESAVIKKDPSFDLAREKEEVSKTVIAFFEAVPDSSPEELSRYLSSEDLERIKEDSGYDFSEIIKPMKEARKNLSKMKISEISIGRESEVIVKECEKEGDFCSFHIVQLGTREEGEWTIVETNRPPPWMIANLTAKKKVPEKELMFPARVAVSFYAFQNPSSKIEIVEQKEEGLGTVWVLYSDKTGNALNGNFHLVEEKETWAIRISLIRVRGGTPVSDVFN